jgi:hypothetical protein
MALMLWLDGMMMMMDQAMYSCFEVGMLKLLFAGMIRPAAAATMQAGTN